MGEDLIGKFLRHWTEKRPVHDGKTIRALFLSFRCLVPPGFSSGELTPSQLVPPTLPVVVRSGPESSFFFYQI